MTFRRLFMALLLTLSFSSPALAAEGSIHIKGPPGMMVFLDGTFVGRTNLEMGGLVLEKVAEGDHVIRLLEDGGSPNELAIRVKPDGITVVQYSAGAGVPPPAPPPGPLSPGNPPEWDSPKGPPPAAPLPTALSPADIPALAGEFVLVPGGSFEMGDVFGTGREVEGPVHRVTISPFLLGAKEVTRGLWEEIMFRRKGGWKGSDQPVAGVSWTEAMEFIGKLNKGTGLAFRLPTEAEWEYASRSGGKKELYAGSDELDQVGWFAGNAKGIKPVAGKDPNGLGLFDMSGNASEWCSDWYVGNWYGKSPGKDPRGPETGGIMASKVLRGGTCRSQAEECTTFRRASHAPADKTNFSGLRLALDVP